MRQRLLPRKGLPFVADLTGIEEQNGPHRTSDVDVLLQVEQQHFVATQDQTRRLVLRTDRSDVEPTHGVLAAEIELLEDRQPLGACRRERVQVRDLRAPAE